MFFWGFGEPRPTGPQTYGGLPGTRLGSRRNSESKRGPSSPQPWTRSEWHDPRPSGSLGLVRTVFRHPRGIDSPRVDPPCQGPSVPTSSNHQRGPRVSPVPRYAARPLLPTTTHLYDPGTKADEGWCDPVGTIRESITLSTRHGATSD